MPLGDAVTEVKHRIDIAQAEFGALWSFWQDCRLPVSMKLRMYRLAVCWTLIHASEAWSLTEEIRKVNSFNSRCLHVITGRPYRETATEPIYDLLLDIRRRRLRYLGHLLRMDPSCLVRFTLLAYLYGTGSIPKGSLLQDCPDMPLDSLVALAKKDN
jgi:hypothetical protein